MLHGSSLCSTLLQGNNMSRIKAFALTLFCLTLTTQNTFNSPITTIIFSFNTLFRPNAQKIQKFITDKLTLRNYVSLLLKGIPSSEEAKDQVFSTLEQIPQVSHLTNLNQWKTPYPSYETGNRKFPPIFCQLLTSQTQAEEQIIFNKISDYVNNNTKIKSKTRRKIVHAIIETIFQTHNMNQFVEPLYEVIAFARDLKNHGYQIIINGNVPGYAWDKFVSDYPQGQFVKELFPEDDCFISGKNHVLKTSDTMYNLILTTHQLIPEQCLVIDSNEKNLQYPKIIGTKTLAFDTETGNINQFKNLVNRLLT